MPTGFQDFWVAGSRFFYKRDAVAGVEQPWIDLGVIESANPSFANEKIELVDGDGGVKTTVTETIVKTDETYEITCRNLNLENLALLFLSDPPSSYVRNRRSYLITLKSWRGYPIALIDNNSGTLLENKVFNLTPSSDGLTGGKVEGVGYGLQAAEECVNVDVSARRLDVSSWVTRQPAAGEKIILSANIGDPFSLGGSLTDVRQAGTYTVESSDTDHIIVEETIPGADQVTDGGIIYYSFSTPDATNRILDMSNGSIADGDDVEVVNSARGIVRLATAPPLLDLTSHTDGSGLKFFFTESALSGSRSLNPQSSQGEITGKGKLFWGRGNNSEQTVREADVSVTPQSSQIQVEDYSQITFSVKVVSDPTETGAGKITYIKGDMPSVS